MTLIFFEENRNALIRDARCRPAAARERARTPAPIDRLRELSPTFSWPFLDEVANDKNCARETSRALGFVIIERRSHARATQPFPRVFSSSPLRSLPRPCSDTIRHRPKERACN